MVERQVSARVAWQFRYVAHSDWVSMDQISPWMGLAVIAAEDQKFPEHWGFDVASIEKAPRTTSAMKTVFAVLQRFLNRQPKISFYGMGVAGSKRAGSRINAGDRNGLEQKAYPDGLPEYRRIWRRCVWRRSCGTTLFPQTREQTYPVGSCITGSCIT